jgi:serine/threonine protein kinase
MTTRAQSALSLRYVPSSSFGPGPTNDVRTPSRVPCKVRGFQIERLIAEGGMGLVFAARRQDTGEDVAIKILRTQHRDDEGLVKRFESEIGYMLRVQHPNVASILSHGRVADGRPYYVMNRYRGATLGKLVANESPIPLTRAVSIVDGVLAGIGGIHAAGIVHRDLQPDNVFVVRRDGETESVKLIDLGFSQEPGVDRGDGITPDSPGALVGTLRFMSPEQATRSRAITKQSDLFSAGLLLYFALTGKLPFGESTERNALSALVRRLPSPIRRERRDVPGAVDVLLRRALAKHPDARFESAGDMRAALARFA